jgi:Holliday junction resolvase
MDTYAKGYRREYQCKKELEALGYLVERKNKAKFCDTDFYNLFDLVAVRGDTTLWVQVKSSKYPANKAVKDILKWKRSNSLDLPCEVWYKPNYKPWVVLKA